MVKYIAEQAGSSSFTLPEEGKYTATVLDCTEKMSSNGNPMLEFWLAIQLPGGGEHKFRDWVVFSPRSMWRVAQMLHGFGRSTREDADIDPTTLIGKTCEIKVKHETRDKYTNLRIEEWIGAAVEEPVREAMTPEQQAGVDRAVKERADRLSEGGEEDDDDVPF